MSGSRRPRIGFVVEQTLGHITHTRNLERLVGPSRHIEAVFAPIEFDVDGLAARLPGYRNWTVRAGLRARLAIRRLRRAGPLDAMFIHTQVPAILVPDQVRRVPTVVSLDATPIQYDELGEHYGHATAGRRLEQLKWQANVRCFARAAAVVTWAHWTKAGLVDRYEVDPAKITVIPPGVDYDRWAAVGAASTAAVGNVGPLQVLFVGGDFARKGGLVLLDAVAHLRGEGVDVELDVVTRDEVPSGEGVRVHHGLAPNSPELIELYHRADVFCLPTLGDCLPMVLSEAGAVGLPLVSTDVGAIHEIVRDGETGLLVPVGDTDALASALRRLAEDPALRQRLGDTARDVVRADFDAATNARRLVDLLVDVGRRGASPARPVLVTVSGTVPADLDAQIAAGRRPRADYRKLAAAFDADVLDHAGALAETGFAGRLIRPLAGANAVLAWACFRRRTRYRTIFTDGEQVGLPYAAVCWLARRRPRHVMIGHLLSPRKKVLLHRALQLRRRIDTVIVYASAQRQFAIDRLGYPPERVALSTFMVDTDFWQPSQVAGTAASRSRPLICAVGQEFRDYATLVDAVRGLDVDVVIAAASPWSKRADTSAGLSVPPNVTVRGFNLFDLRQLYADSALVVVPLAETDFQAGITTILEAMSMGRAVVCTRTTGQTDTIVDEVTGLYVPHGDPAALRAAIERVLIDDELRARLAAAGQAWVRQHAGIDAYARRLTPLVLP